MAMKRLSSLMLRKWKEKERWTGRRRSEPYAGGEEEEEEEERQTDRRDRQADRRMLRRKSEPCGPMDGEVKMEENKSAGRWKERRKSESSVEEEVRRDRRRAERRKSTSWIIVEDNTGGQTDRRQMTRRRSEPCGVLYVQLLPLSNRKRKELLQRRMGHRKSCSEDGDGASAGTQEVRKMSRGRSDPTGPLAHSKQSPLS